VRSVLYRPFERLAARRLGVILALAWGVAEALWWPIVPDFYVFALSPVAPRRWWRLAVAASIGSVAGGAVGYAFATSLGSRGLLAAAPLVTDGMIDTARSWLEAGPVGLMRQPLSGIPYKVFVFLAASQRLNFVGFVLFSALARSLRIFAVGGSGALLGAAARPDRVKRFYNVFFILFCVVFALGLWRVIRQFS
jgi:membrane protein YqaA with SNARE-associated domain